MTKAQTNGTRAEQKQDVADYATILVAIIIGVFVLVVVWMVLRRDGLTIISIQSSSRAQDFDAASAVAYGERMAELAGLTIVTVLTTGGAILGLNWYSARRNYQDERERIKDQEGRLDALMSQQDKKVVDALGQQDATNAALAKSISDLRDEFNSLRERVDADRSMLAESIASTIETLSFTGIDNFFTPSSSTFRTELVMLSRALRALDRVGPFETKTEIADRIITKFLDRYTNLFAEGQTIETTAYEQFTIDHVSTLVWTLASQSVVARWIELIRHFESGKHPSGSEPAG